MKVVDFSVPAGCALAGIAVGTIIGYFIAKKKLKEKYEKEANEQLQKYIKENIVGSKPTKEQAEKIAKDFPTESWTEAFKKDQEKRKDYKNILRKEQYVDDDGNEVSKEDIFDDEKFDKKNLSKSKEIFEDQLQEYSEYSGISTEELLKCPVHVISESEYYDDTHDSEPEEFEWDPKAAILRSEDGEILEPIIIFGEDYKEILQEIEEKSPNDTWVHDERLEKYYCISVLNPRYLK